MSFIWWPTFEADLGLWNALYMLIQWPLGQPNSSEFEEFSLLLPCLLLEILLLAVVYNCVILHVQCQKATEGLR